MGDLTNPESDAFTNLANLYLNAFTQTLSTVGTGEVGTLTSIKFATIRVMSFALDTSPVRKRRETDNLRQIKAEMETVYNVQGKGENVDSGRSAVLAGDIKATVYDEVETAVEEKVNAIITPQTPADHVNGELNFLRAADVSQVVEERDLLAA